MFRTQERLRKFYSDHSVHPDRIRDNQLFAQWAIGEALRAYSPETSFQVTGEIKKGKELTVGTDKTAVPKKLVAAIQAEGQKEVDAETCEDRKGNKDADSEIFQDIGTVAESIIAASPNSLGPPIEACASYLLMHKCGEYGRNKLAVWRSPLFRKLDYREDRRGFLDNQITAIVWILSRFLGALPRLNVRSKKTWDPRTRQYVQPPETAQQRSHRERLRGPRYFGGILADSMGLGKTLTTIACIDLLAGQGLNIKVEDGRTKYRPMLILVPNVTVAMQWVDEIDKVAGRHSIIKVLTSGNGVRRGRDGENRVRVLTCKEFTSYWPESLGYVWDEDHPDAARTVFVMSIDAWSRRTCRPRKIKREDVGPRAKGDEEYEMYSTFTESGRKFSIVVVDEAYKVKHSGTGYWKSVALLDRQFTLLITATPCMNMLSDLLGPARLLWQSPEKYLQGEQTAKWKNIESEFTDLLDLERLDELAPWDDFQLVAGRPSMLTEVMENQVFRGCHHFSIDKTRRFLKYFESLAILRRAPSSRLFSDWEKTKLVSLDGLLPKVTNLTVDIQSDRDLEKEYQDIHIDLLMRYMHAIIYWQKGDVTPIVATYRQFQLVSASLDVYRLDQIFSRNNFGTKAPDVRAMRAAKVSFMDLAPFLLELGDPEPEVALDFVKLAVRKSPILRYILHHVKENLLERGPNGKIQKLLITEASPMLAYYYELVLQFLLVHCRTLHAGLSQEERRDLIESFNDDDDHSCQVMIQMYTVGFAGSNLHRNCSQVLVASQAHSLPVQWQAVHRVIRVGQESDVKVVRLKVNNSFHSFRESRQVEKILPELGTRAQGSTNDVLVQLLNLFQSEVNEAWETPEAEKLLETKNMFVEQTYLAPGGEPSGKRIKLEDETFAETGTVASAADKAPVEPPKVLLMTKNRAKRGIDEISKSAKTDCKSYFQNDDEFLALKTRHDYYNEYKQLPVALKSSFSNAKNEMRRTLSYGGPDQNRTRRVWTVEDLEEPAVLERAMELMLRVRLGANAVGMLPYPQIDFSLVSQEKREKLEKILSKTNIIDQDMEDAPDDGNQAKSKSGQVGHEIRSMHGKSMVEKDKIFRESTARGPTNAIRNLGRADKETRKMKIKTEVDEEVAKLDAEETSDDDGSWDDDDDSDDGVPSGMPIGRDSATVDRESQELVSASEQTGGIVDHDNVVVTDEAVVFLRSNTVGRKLDNSPKVQQESPAGDADPARDENEPLSKDQSGRVSPVRVKRESPLPGISVGLKNAILIEDSD
ncbi:SNF2 family N-terminal domain-containing protein [Hypoxylon sp. FL1284]|nr:SNF2 family N-terminal domain-containing protein [Hypoxylon sp. FL1284]